MNREIGIIIRVKQAAEAKQQIKQIVDRQILEHIKKLNLGLKETGDEVEKTGRKAKDASVGLDKFFRSAAKGAGILYTVRRSLSFAFQSFEEGAGLERAGVQFENSVGKISSVLPQLRAATRGTVEDMKLLQTANRAVIEGLDPRRLAGMYRMATVASRKLGLDTEQSIQTISNAIIRQDESALTTLGTILKTNIGLKVQSALIAKNGGVMSGAMAVQIRQAVIMAELNKRFSGFNDLQEDSVEIIGKFRAAMTNLRMAIGQTLGVALAPVLKVLTSLAQTTADFLNTMKDNAGFKAFVQYSATIATIFTARKLLGGLSAAVKLIGGFTLGLKGAAVLAAGFIGFKALGGDLNDISKFAEKAQTAFSVFFQLLNNYDSKTGLTSVLTKDKDALGGFFNMVFEGAKIFLALKSVVVGVFKGIRSVLMTVAPLFGVFGDGIVEAMKAIGDGQPILQSTLNKLERLGEMAGKAAVLFAAAFGASALGNMITYFATMSFQIASVTKKYWAMAAAWAAANPITAAAVGVGAGLYFGNEAAEALGLNKASSRDTSRGNTFSSVPQQEASPTPRAQNIDAAGMNMEQMMSFLANIDKNTRRTADTNEQMKMGEEQKSLQDNARQFVTPATAFK